MEPIAWMSERFRVPVRVAYRGEGRGGNINTLEMNLRIFGFHLRRRRGFAWEPAWLGYTRSCKGTGFRAVLATK